MDQPIPAERLKQLYTSKLELMLEQVRLQEHAREVRAIESSYVAATATLEKEFAVDLADWEIDLKAGTMTRVTADARAAARRGKRKAHR